MLRYLFAFIMLVHGLIHVMGFAKAFGYGNLNQLTKDVPKSAGFFWLLTAVLFITATLLFLFKNDSWSYAAIVAMILSQVLIIIFWKDARFGTIANFLVLLVALPAMAENNFNRMVKSESTALLSAIDSGSTLITIQMLQHLPPICRAWLVRSGVVGNESIQFVRLKQCGEMRTKPEGKWMHFTATQYFSVNEPQFVWQTQMHMAPLLTLTGRDKLEKGNGNMLIKFLSLVDVVNKGKDSKMNQSTMLRFLAETCWFPTAALSSYIKWEAIDSLSAKATMNYKSQTVSGVFQFNSDGDVISFTSDRWFSNDMEKDFTLEKWFIEMKAYRSFHGIRIPSKSEVTWKLKSGDFNWLKLEIIDIEFNKAELYPS